MAVAASEAEIFLTPETRELIMRSTVGLVIPRRRARSDARVR
jgi:hypothetical protein